MSSTFFDFIVKKHKIIESKPLSIFGWGDISPMGGDLGLGLENYFNVLKI